MLKSWTIKNFKSIKGLNKLDLAPLTIFAGANSSGKSTVLQSLLLTAQTMQNSVSTKSIILNGHIMKFGTFSDVLTNGSEDRTILMGFELEPIADETSMFFDDSGHYIVGRNLFLAENYHKMYCEFSFTDKEINSKSQSEVLQLQPRLERTFFSIFNRSNMANEEIEIKCSDVRSEQRILDLEITKGTFSQKMLQSLEYEVLKPKDYMGSGFFGESAYRKGEYVGAYLNHFVPKELYYVYDKENEEIELFLNLLCEQTNLRHPSEERLYNRFINNALKTDLLKAAEEAYSERISNMLTLHKRRADTAMTDLKNEFDYQNFINFKNLPGVGRFYLQKLYDNKDTYSRHIQRNAKDLRLSSSSGQVEFTETIEHFFKRNLKYLGPLRDEPKPVYPLSGSSDPRDIGFRGENTAAVLDVHRNTVVKYIPPSSFRETQQNFDVVEAPLISAVLEWLEYLGVAKSIVTLDKGKLGHELKISNEGSLTSHDLTHVGVGVSQVLPILVLSLLADVDSTLIFEQPELHLHPKVQTRIADFFVSMIKLKKQCLVETHSEYLIQRLRYQIAMSERDILSKDIMIYFVEKHEDASVYKRISINEYGVIENWPSGFFDENEENASELIRAAIDKKKKLK